MSTTMEQNLDISNLLYHVMSYQQIPPDHSKYQILRQYLHDLRGPCRYRTCDSQKLHYHYLVNINKFHHEKSLRNHRNLMGKRDIKCKRIVSKQHLENLLRYMKEYEEIVDTESGETIGSTDTEDEEYLPEITDAPKTTKRKRIASDEIIKNSNLHTPLKIKEAKEDMVSDEMLEKQFQKCVDTKGSEDYKYETQKYFMLQSKLQAIKCQTEAMDRLIMQQSPMTMNEYEVLEYDYNNKKSVYRSSQLIDIWLKRKSDPIKKDKIPIFILVGKTSCGKSKIAQAFANAIGKSTYPILNYSHNDTLGLSHWASTGSNIMVFDDFDFESATDKNKPSKIFELLKQWASGIEIHPRMALNTRRNLENFTVKVKAIIISVNKISMETQNMVQRMPEFTDRIEYIPFTDADSYANDMWRNLIKYENAAAVADRCLTQYLKMYLEVREWKPIFSEWVRYMKEYNAYPIGSIERKMVQNVCASEMPCFYPFSMGIYNENLVCNN